MRCTKCFRQRSRVAAILSLLVAKVDPMIENVAGDHMPDLPTSSLTGRAATVDLTGIGELWDGKGVATVVTPLPRPIEASTSVMKELRDHTPEGFMGKREHTPDKPLGVTRLLAGLHCKDAAEPDCDPARQSNRARQYPCD
jgi:hypothetical protein